MEYVATDTRISVMDVANFLDQMWTGLLQGRQPHLAIHSQRALRPRSEILKLEGHLCRLLAASNLSWAAAHDIRCYWFSTLHSRGGAGPQCLIVLRLDE